jgi:hypothetical protein
VYHDDEILFDIVPTINAPLSKLSATLTIPLVGSSNSTVLLLSDERKHGRGSGRVSKLF